MDTVEQTLLEEAARNATSSAVLAAARALAAGQMPTQSAFVARALTAVAHLASAMDEEALSDAVAAPSEYEVLVRALSAPDALPALSGRYHSPASNHEVMNQDEAGLVLAEARHRGLREREWLLQAEGGMWTVEDVARHLRLSRQAVDKRRQKRRLIGLSLGRRGYAYPRWQFTPEGVLPGLEAVLGELIDVSSWTQAAFLLHANVRLNGESPLAMLRTGRLEEVRRAARAYGEQGSA